MAFEKADLTFNMDDGSLRGAIDGKHISARAGSGGRAGSKTAGATNYFLENNPFATYVKLNEKDSKSVGGTLPLGRYLLRTHESRANWLRLVPDSSNAMKSRAGFAIHGRGKRGSDGCIVPSDFNVVLLLYKLTKAREKAQKPAPTLDVVAIGTDVDRKRRQMLYTA